MDVDAGLQPVLLADNMPIPENLFPRKTRRVLNIVCTVTRWVENPPLEASFRIFKFLVLSAVSVNLRGRLGV